MRKKFIDENGRIFGTISVIDVIVIIVAAILVAAIYVKFNVKETTAATQDSEMSYQLKIQSARESVLGSIKTGDIIYDKNGNSVGVIDALETGEALDYVQTADGAVVESVVPDRVSITLTVTAPCSQSDGRYYANRTFGLNINSYNEFYTKYYAFSAYITEIG